jgi:hypothetical protein
MFRDPSALQIDRFVDKPASGGAIFSRTVTLTAAPGCSH